MYNNHKSKRALLAYKEELEQTIRKCDKALEDIPDGTIVGNNKNGKIYYSHYISHMEYRLRKGISKDAELIDALIKKETYAKLREECKVSLTKVNALLDADAFNVESKVIDLLESWKKPLACKLLQERSEQVVHWISENFRTNPYKPERRNIKAANGIMVRSKSEREIANCLYNNHVPFRYEAELLINGEPIYPDFTILNPANGKIYYWEHAGMIDVPEYVNNNSKKLLLYASIGYFVGENLIVTSEGNNHALETEHIMKTIESNFL